MTATDWIVIAAGAAGIVWVNWYFFVTARSGQKPTASPRIEG